MEAVFGDGPGERLVGRIWGCGSDPMAAWPVAPASLLLDELQSLFLVCGRAGRYVTHSLLDGGTELVDPPVGECPDAFVEIEDNDRVRQREIVDFGVTCSKCRNRRRWRARMRQIASVAMEVCYQRDGPREQLGEGDFWLV